MTRSTRVRVLWAGLAAGAALAGAAPPAAAAPRTPPPPLYGEECGSCHLAYPARFLDPASWAAVLAGLDQHFGSDASLDPETLAAIRAWLEAGARKKPTARDGRPLLRISETGWFRHEHPRPGAAIWAHPEVRSPANCAACHREAESGRYGEGSLRVPGRTGRIDR